MRHKITFGGFRIVLIGLYIKNEKYNLGKLKLMKKYLKVQF